MSQLIECYIGIDPGAETGFAAWDPALQEFEELASMGFWDVFYKVLGYPHQSTLLVVEDPNLNAPTFPRGLSKAASNKLSQNVGQNKRDAQLLIEGWEAEGFTVQRVKPSGKKGTKRKWTAETFKRITGQKKGYNQHIRDAAMMVFGLKRVPISRYQKEEAV